MMKEIVGFPARDFNRVRVAAQTRSCVKLDGRVLIHNLVSSLWEGENFILLQEVFITLLAKNL